LLLHQRKWIPAFAHCCPRNFRNIRESENHAENQLLPLLAEPVLDSIGEGGWEGVNPCGKASGKYSPHPNPPLQAGEGAVCGELIDLALNILFCELPPVWICAEAFLLNAVPLRLQIFPRQQYAFAGMTTVSFMANYKFDA
jgi:hypothetical protein